MRRWTGRNRRVLVPVVSIVVIAFAGLLIAGSRHLSVRTATADAPNQLTIATLRPGQVLCEGPLTSHGTASGVGIWGSAAGGTARSTITVKDPSTHETLASGSLQAVPSNNEWPVRLSAKVPGGRPVQVCLTQDAGSFLLGGSAVSYPDVSATGTPGGQRFALVLLSDGRSWIDSLSLAFSRASLWRPSWVGAWTFWVLAVALLMTFGLGVVAVVRAADDDGSPPSAEQPPDGPVDDLPSEPREDRPQPVS